MVVYHVMQIDDLNLDDLNLACQYDRYDIDTYFFFEWPDVGLLMFTVRRDQLSCRLRLQAQRFVIGGSMGKCRHLQNLIT